ncbi:MAG: hypothetical protein GYB20_01815 [Oceanospirillales bacterium]|nr:hypothetical protein [Oceanospirillales bacterium]MBR9886427.1 hypothetical protein [Oceanospirillales bacterium]
MDFCQKSNKPVDLKIVQTLIVDRSLEFDFSKTCPLVCLSLNRTLFHVIKYEEATTLPKSWLVDSIELGGCKKKEYEHCIVLLRPGTPELLLELKRYTTPMIYSCESDGFIDDVMVAFSIAQGGPEVDGVEEKANAFMDIYTWSREQCIETNRGYEKSLGALVDTYYHIDDVWIIDDQPDLVDFASHVLTVPRFFGDPTDRALFKLMDDIFIN